MWFWWLTGLAVLALIGSLIYSLVVPLSDEELRREAQEDEKWYR